MNKKARCFLALCILFSLLSFPWSKAAEPTKQISIYVNGIHTGMSTHLLGESTYVPLREFCAALADCSISWDDARREATITCKGLSMTIPNKGEYFIANGRCLFFARGVYSSNGHLYLPVRALAKAFGATVTWNPGSMTVSVTPGTPILSADNYYGTEDLHWLSRLISAESKGEPLLGQIAVGNVVLNRVHSGRYPNTIYDVIFDMQYGVQFEPVENKMIYNDPDPLSVLAAKICLEGYQVADNSLYFLNERIAKSKWIVNHCSYVMTIGNHTFYQ